jgi:hypothetical protein
MKPDEALQVLDQAASVAPLNRQSHIAVQEAVATLRLALTDLEEKEAPEEAKMPSRDGAKEPAEA